MRKIDLDGERAFENRKASGEMVREAQSKYYWATEIPTSSHIESTNLEIRGKSVLEVGCSSGYDALTYCEYANSYVGVDISDEAINNCKKLKIGNANFFCTDGHTLPINDNSVDCVIVNSLLHHMDLNTIFCEIRRVLKKGGVLIFKEPLGTNPFFQIYRSLTSYARTVDERPFTFSDLNLMSTFFDLKSIQWFGFTNILSAFFRSNFLRFILTKLDSIISKTPIKFMFWQISGVVEVKK